MAEPSHSAAPFVLIEAGQRWADQYGEARVLAVAEGYAMLRRPTSNPFIVPLGLMRSGRYGWHQVHVPTIAERANG